MASRARFLAPVTAADGADHRASQFTVFGRAALSRWLWRPHSSRGTIDTGFVFSDLSVNTYRDVAPWAV